MHRSNRRGVRRGPLARKVRRPRVRGRVAIRQCPVAVYWRSVRRRLSIQAVLSAKAAATLGRDLGRFRSHVGALGAFGAAVESATAFRLAFGLLRRKVELLRLTMAAAALQSAGVRCWRFLQACSRAHGHGRGRYNTPTATLGLALGRFRLDVGTPAFRAAEAAACPACPLTRLRQSRAPAPRRGCGGAVKRAPGKCARCLQACLALETWRLFFDRKHRQNQLQKITCDTPQGSRVLL
eukprot:scaffold16475_cov70-Phaeocystis_antarctica.AAC.2